MNKKLKGISLLAALLCASAAGAAIDETDKRMIDRLAKGGPETIRDVAQTIFDSHTTKPEVLDVAAEVLLTQYPRASLDRNTSDAMAWLCRALGGSGNARYKAAIDEVAEKAENRKLRGHCEKSSGALPKQASADSYKLGTVNLEALRADTQSAPKAGASAQASAAKSEPGKKVDFSLIREGMSSQEVLDILGPPSAQTQHMTGKQFRPFNFGAKDLQRLYYLYKGVGRIEFSLKSAYEGVYRVIAIRPDANESGYP